MLELDAAFDVAFDAMWGIGSSQGHRPFGDGQRGARRIRELRRNPGERNEKVGEGRRRSEKVSEGLRRSEKV